MTSETSESGDVENDSGGAAVPSAENSQAPMEASGTDAQGSTAPQPEGRRTQLKIVRENIETLSGDIGTFRRKHELSIKRLEKQVATLRADLAAQSVAKDLGSFRKTNDANAKRLEKQVASLRNELADMKSRIAKDAAKSRARQEAILSKILTKVSAKKAPKPKPAKKK